MGARDTPLRVIADIAEPLAACRAGDSLGSFEETLARGLPAVCLVGGSWRILLPRHCVGYARSRQFRDLPSEDAVVVAPDTPFALALSAAEQSCGLVVVAEGERLLGTVSHAQLVDLVGQEANRADGLARLLEASLTATRRACWSVELGTDAQAPLHELPLRFVGPFADVFGFPIHRGAQVRECLLHVAPDDRALVEEHLRALIADGAPRTVTYRVEPPGAEGPRWIEDAGASICDAEGVRIVFGFVRDVTRERERADRAVQQARLAAVGHLAAHMAHETNNMLAIIAGSLSLLTRPGADAAVVVRELDHIREASERLGWLMRQITAVGGKEPRHVRRVDLNAVVTDAADALRDALGPSVDLVLELGSEPYVVDVDPTQLRQALVHLASNAREAMPDGGRLVVRTTRRLGAAAHDPEADVVELRVSDTGRGITPDAVAHVFDPYFTTKKTGTGLGLAIVQGVVAQSGGSVRVERTDGSGTCFLIELPVSSGDASSAEASVGAVASDALASDLVHTLAADGAVDATVLVVDDEPALRRIARRLIERAGMRVVTAASGEEALGILATRGATIDVLVTDLAMPGLSGADLARATREFLPRLPIVYVSGHFDAAAFQGIQDLPEGTYLAKPFAPEALVGAVGEALGRPVPKLL